MFFQESSEKLKAGGEMAGKKGMKKREKQEKVAS